MFDFSQRSSKTLRNETVSLAIEMFRCAMFPAKRLRNAQSSVVLLGKLVRNKTQQKNENRIKCRRRKVLINFH